MKRVAFKSNIGKLNKRVRNRLNIKMKSIASLLAGYLDRSLEGDSGRTGRQYRRPDGTPYTASAPGEWPSEKSGDLRKSIDIEVTVTNAEISLTMSAPVPYAQDLEFFMDRPFISRAFTENLDEIKSILGKPIL